ncbi:beta-lactamase family protein [Aspergillus ellipticus CBS 707.79]|uniref:Beta-lactamase family protein n=1 Tax=Aspergillus ellipticus CBS 707.79 TaxID=1448320 RepID=A0A319DGV4_9EURO|nr:beta-lactamase family protein [Aspergillus ellipticus CBS 707.79]
MVTLSSPDFQALVERLIDQHHVPGLSIALVQGDQVTSAAYGHASLDPPTPCTPDTLFDIASASKSMTAASVALLVEDDERYPAVKYDAVVSRLLPDDFVLPGQEYTDGVTVEDILSHRTGMAGHDLSYLGPQAARPDDARSVTRNLRHLPMAAPIRAKYMYCNMMYTVATHLVEQQSGLPFADYLDDRFFRPLGMSASNLQPQRARARGLGSRIATGHAWDEDAQRYRSFQTPDCPEAQGAGSIITSVNDYIRWVKAMMHHGSPVSAAVFKGLVAPRIIANPGAEDLDPYTSPTLYAAGWEIYYYRGHQVIGHDGAIPGFGSCHFFLPDWKFGGVIVGNAENGNLVASILARRMIDEVLQVPSTDRPDWEEILSTSWASSSEPSEAELREKLCPQLPDPAPPQLPLAAYTGVYEHPGYHRLTVEIRDGALFVDATDRSFGFTLTLDYVGDQTKYIAHLRDYLDGCHILLMAEFELANGRAVRLGVNFEEELETWIWFERA